MGSALRRTTRPIGQAVGCEASVDFQFVFDMTRIKTELGWRPTRTNTELLIESYDRFIAYLDEIYSGGAGRSAHRQPVKLQALALIKKLS